MKTIFLLILVSLISCVKNDSKEFAIQYDPPRGESNDEYVDMNIYHLKDIPLDNKVDIMFVVDNSGSMGPIQDNIIKNAGLFMGEFINRSYIDWKLGLISTDGSEAPYLGFKEPYSANEVDFGDPSSIDQAISTFQTAFRALGTWGSGYEKVFYNIDRVLKKYNDPNTDLPDFVRGNSHLAIIMVSDEAEQSDESRYVPKDFLNELDAYVAGFKIVRFYGALQMNDFEDCEPSSYSIDYEGSRYKEIIDASNGFVISACADDFGTQLADISKDIASLIKSPGVPLRGKYPPKVHTIKIMYKGKELKPGPEETGGTWYYNDIYNKIVFYNFEWVEDFKKDHLVINFEFDDGISRPGDPEDGSRDGTKK